MKLFVDSWGWIVLANPKDRDHRDAAVSYRRSERSGGIVTSDFVLDETFTFLFSRSPHAQAWRYCGSILESGEVKIEAINRERFMRAFELRRRFADKPRISFTDLTSMVLMAELEISEILTADAHFSQVGMGFRRLPAEKSES